MNWFDDKLKEIEETNEFKFEAALLEFEETLAKDLKPMPPEFSEAVSKCFWKFF